MAALLAFYWSLDDVFVATAVFHVSNDVNPTYSFEWTFFSILLVEVFSCSFIDSCMEIIILSILYSIYYSRLEHQTKSFFSSNLLPGVYHQNPLNQNGTAITPQRSPSVPPPATTTISSLSLPVAAFKPP